MVGSGTRALRAVQVAVIDQKNRKPGQQPPSIFATGATISFGYVKKTQGGKHAGRGWRARLNLKPGGERIQSAARVSIVEAVNSLLERGDVQSLICESERDKAREGAAALQGSYDAQQRALPVGTLQMRQSADLTSFQCAVKRKFAERVRAVRKKPAAHEVENIDGFQPSADASIGSSDNIADSHQTESVQFVHQIYGLFGDNKPMSEVFVRSHTAWKQCAVGMDATYILWDSDQLETLMRVHYPEFWDMYKNVRYPVMRVDIGRIAILHHYGGLYADLDTFPNRIWYARSQLAVCSVEVPPGGWRGRRAVACSQEGDMDEEFGKLMWDMEVLVGTCQQPIFMAWLEYIKSQIQQKPYKQEQVSDLSAGKHKWYAQAKMRYIYIKQLAHIA